MKDLDYFIATASNSTQREFELDFADIIEVYNTNETTITTECGRTVIITWQDNYFKSYHVIYETAQMSEGEFVRNRIEQIISNLRSLTLKGDCVDGETMQYIIEKVGMEDQMTRQLMFTADRGYVENLWEEIVELEKSHD